MVALLCITIAIVLLVARLNSIGRYQRLPFSNCTVPCFAGATIGETSVNDAIPLMSQDLALSGYLSEKPLNDTFFSWVKKSKSKDMNDEVVNAKFEKGVLVQIGLKTVSLFQLGDLMVTLGSPSCVLTDDKQAFFDLYYLNEKYIITVGVSKLELDQGVQFIDLSLNTSANRDCANISASNWQGLSLGKYHP